MDIYWNIENKLIILRCIEYSYFTDAYLVFHNTKRNETEEEKTMIRFGKYHRSSVLALRIQWFQKPLSQPKNEFHLLGALSCVPCHAMSSSRHIRWRWENTWRRNIMISAAFNLKNICTERGRATKNHLNERKKNVGCIRATIDITS